MEDLKSPGGHRGESKSDTSGGENDTPHRRLRPGTKLYTVLSALAAGRSFNRFEAERQLHDHALPSTIADIQSRFGISVERRMERVPCLGGTKTADVARYFLAPLEVQKARQLLTAEDGAGAADKNG